MQMCVTSVFIITAEATFLLSVMIIMEYNVSRYKGKVKLALAAPCVTWSQTEPPLMLLHKIIKPCPIGLLLSYYYLV